MASGAPSTFPTVWSESSPTILIAARRGAVAELGYVRGGAGGELAAHPRRSTFATWLFQPAATGQYPKKGRLVERPVPVIGVPWPGVPVRDRNAAGRAGACWLPIADGLTPHGLRHLHKTLMEELGTPNGSVQGREVGSSHRGTMLPW